MADPYGLGTLSADQIQSPDDPAVTLAERSDGRLEDEIRDALRKLRDAVVVDQIAQLLAGLRYVEVLQIDFVAATADGLKQAFDTAAELYVSAAQDAAGEIGTALGETVAFDRLAPDVTAELVEYREAFVADIVGSTRTGMVEAIQRGMAQALPATEVAQEIADGLGLAPNQAQAVINFRRMLESLDRAVLDRALRDRRFDPTIRAAIEADEALTDEQIDRMVSRYAERYVAHRAEMIARTEALRAVNRGRQAAYEQKIADGTLDAGDVRRFWLVNWDERLCPVCRSIPLLNPDGRGIDEPFVGVDGPVDEAPEHPACRCSIEYSVAATAVAAEPWRMAAE